MSRGVYPRTEEMRKNISLSHKGKKRPPFSKEWRMNMSKERIKAYKEGRRVPYMLGKRWSKEHKKRMSLAMKGKHLSKTEFKKGHHYPKDIELKRIIGLKRAYKEGRRKPIYPKGFKSSKELIRKRLRRRTPSSLELKMIKIIEKNNLPYKFVGNGKFFIENKNPDFINCNGEKIAVEVYYRKHKELFRGGVEDWKRERTVLFNKEGWGLEFFDESQINDDEVLRRLIK